MQGFSSMPPAKLQQREVIYHRGDRSHLEARLEQATRVLVWVHIGVGDGPTTAVYVEVDRDAFLRAVRQNIAPSQMVEFTTHGEELVAGWDW